MADKTLKGKACQLKINTAVIRNVQKLLAPGSDVQKFVDMEIARLSDKYVPSDTAAIRKSVFVKSDFGSGEITYEIYGRADGRNTWNDTVSQFQGRPMRGSFWAFRMLNSGGSEKLGLAVRRFIAKRGL